SHISRHHRSLVNQVVFSKRRPASSTLFPYTTLFRSTFRPKLFISRRVAKSGRPPVNSAASFSSGCQASARGGSRLRARRAMASRSEEHTSELQSRENLVCRLLLEKKKREDNRGDQPR